MTLRASSVRFLRRTARQFRSHSTDLEKARAKACQETARSFCERPRLSKCRLQHWVITFRRHPTIDAMVYEAAARNGLDPCLILSVMRAESGFRRMAVSPKGASGLMQLMPATAARFGVKNIFDPRENVLAGSVYLRGCSTGSTGTCGSRWRVTTQAKARSNFTGFAYRRLLRLRTMCARYTGATAAFIVVRSHNDDGYSNPESAEHPPARIRLQSDHSSTSSSGDGKTGR